MNSDPKVPKVQLSQQPFSKPDKLHDIFAENYKEVRKKLPKINSSMSLYISNKDIEQIIMKRIKVFITLFFQIHFTCFNIHHLICLKNNMQQTYQEIALIIVKNYTEEEQLIVACPTNEQISLWMTIS